MKVAVLLSGGVDSSVALRLLAEQKKYDLTAFYLKIWLEDEFQFLGECPWEEDLEFARSVCDQLGIPLKVVSLQKEYWDRVVSYTISELKEGRTPSPDIFCNQRIKYGAFNDSVDSSFDKIASGHYAQVVEEDGLFWLKRGDDPIKDQTYFLSHLSQQQLSRCLFPIGSYAKKEVRELASKYGLSTHDRRDSQGICFLGKIKYNDFVEGHLGKKPGKILEWQTEKHLGDHNGYWFHTIGQRRGLGLGGGPWFVVSKDIENNVIYVSSKEELLNRAKSLFHIENTHWITKPPQNKNLLVKIRHGERRDECEVRELSEGRWEIKMANADPGIAPGQFAVLYDGDICLGGGMIQNALT